MEDITLIGKKREFARSISVPCGTEWRNDWKWVSYLLGCVPSLQMKEMCLVILGKGPKVVAQGDSNTDQPGFWIPRLKCSVLQWVYLALTAFLLFILLLREHLAYSTHPPALSTAAISCQATATF